MKLKTTIEQVTGFHADGTPYVALKEIVTHAADYACDPEDPNDLPSTEWLEKQHAAIVALESIRDPAHRERALEWARDVEADDLPRMVDRIIAETEANHVDA